MNKPENDNQSLIEDLTVSEDRAAEIKGGKGVVFVGGWGSSSYQYAFSGN